MSLTVQEVKSELQKLDSMWDLHLNKFCEPEGYAHSLVQRWGKEGLKPTQLRKVFNQLKARKREVEKERDKEFNREKILPLLPMLAYACGRDLIPKDFYDIMKICLGQEKLKTNKDFVRLVEFVEAILAFHKFEFK